MSRSRHWRATAVTATILIVAVIATLAPLAVIASAALQEPGSSFTGISWPAHPHWENFATAWNIAGFASLFASSGTVALVVVPLGVLFSTLGGYALSRYVFRGRIVVMGVLLLGMTLPYESIVIPLYYGFNSLHLLNTSAALFLPLTGAFMPFGIFWMKAHFDALPPSLIEAAELDGAGTAQLFRSILIPTARPALSTLAVLFFMWSWNQFLLALILIQDPSRRTAPAGLGQFVSQYGKDIPLLSAASLLVITPVVIVYLIFQRQFVRGILQGAVR